MAHKNREKRAAKKAREAEKANPVYEDEYYDDDEEDEYEYYDDDDDYEDEAPRRRRGPHPAIIALIVTVAIVGGGFYGLKVYYEKSLEPTVPGNEDPVTFIIEEGSSTSVIATRLKDYGLIKSEYIFRIHCKRMEYETLFKFGEYTLNKGMTVDEIANVIIAGTTANENTRSFTIPEGFNTIQIAKRLAEENIVDESDFYYAVESSDYDYAFLEGCPEGQGRLEGFLYPETYEIYTDATAQDIVSKMLAQFDANFRDEYYTRAQELGVSVRDIVTMGSIVERESVKPEERPLMAGVFYNRLEQGMPLQSCATIQYILGEPKEFLTDADTQIESPYNTYLHDGLPPGPICNPRMASIEAALFPDENDYIYFVLKPELDGYHNFSADYNEFLRNKDAYYAVAEEG